MDLLIIWCWVEGRPWLTDCRQTSFDGTCCETLAGCCDAGSRLKHKGINRNLVGGCSLADEWKLDESGETTIPIIAKRIEDVPGTHTVTYKSEVDTITIDHVANNRQGFALGAVIAAEWLVGKKGVYTMNDVLNIG